MYYCESDLFQANSPCCVSISSLIRGLSGLHHPRISIGIDGAGSPVSGCRKMVAEYSILSYILVLLIIRLPIYVDDGQSIFHFEVFVAAMSGYSTVVTTLPRFPSLHRDLGRLDRPINVPVIDQDRVTGTQNS